jgi:hypothetical protein
MMAVQAFSKRCEAVLSVKLVKQFYQTGEARPADWDVPETGD